MSQRRIDCVRAFARLAPLLAGALLAACSGGKPRPTARPSAATPAAQVTAAGPAQPAVRKAANAAAATSAPAEPSTPDATSAPAVSPAATVTAAPRPVQVTLTPLGQTDLGDSGFNGNVWVHNGFAYIGAYGSGSACPASGVRIVDVSDPAKPTPVAAAAALPGSSQEDVRVQHVDSPAFSGDLLAVGIQHCGRAGQGGLALVDVSDPRHPATLSFFSTDPGIGVHELDLVQQGDRMLALLAVPYAERDHGTGEFRIVDVSDPRHPKQLSAWGAGKALGVDLSGGIGCNRQIFAHSAHASADGRRAYLSYWDAGEIVLDISNPTAPRLIAWIRYPPGEEGETHSAAEANGGNELLIADESGIFGPPPGLHLRVDAPDGPRQVAACEALYSASLNGAGVIAGSLVDGGGCGAVSAAVRGRVALLDAGPCQPYDQAARAIGAGAVAAIVMAPGDAVSLGGGRGLGAPVVVIGASDGAALQAALANAPLPVTLPSERHSGGVRIWDISDPAAPRQLSEMQTADSTTFPAPGPGYYSAHNPFVVGNLAFVSWYTDGVRVFDISDPTAPRELAAYVPPVTHNPLQTEFPDTPLVWGAYVAGDVVYLSDINGGLYTLRWARAQGTGNRE
ncbi:MAG TPA: PA domain-containing protein [Dehalococcoidia bacterium]|nr:PA domain-containing protein [Dehalococcoidia bacterium]